MARGETEGLRAAQIAATHAIAAHFWSKSRPAIVVMPTGSGKTAVMILASILLRAARVLVVVPSRLLSEQVADDFLALDPLLRIGALPAEVDRPRVLQNRRKIVDAEGWAKASACDVFVTTPYAASPGIREVSLPDPDLFDLVIFDEAHHTPAPIYRALSEAFPRAKQLRFTATPFRRDEREIGGDIVFTYDVARARRDGVFGALRFVPVEATGLPKERDVAIAKAAAAQLAADRAAGLAHRLVVRAAGTDRAGELAEIYKAETSLELETVHSGHSKKKVDRAIEALRAGELEGVIAVDMLGEGFNLPNLKVAALHAPHRSLAVTLQFIGRFARTASEDPLGEATFFAVPSEIEGAASRLYVPGAEWNELVEQLSRDRIEEETETRALIRTFRGPEPDESAHDDGAGPASLDDLDDDTAWALLRTVRPYFHVKVYETLGAVDLDAPLAVPAGLEPLLVRHSREHHALVWVGRRVSRVLWSRHPGWTDVSHELFIVAHVPEHSLLFICASTRENTVYDALVGSVLGEQYLRLAPNEVHRVLHGVTAPRFFSVGMRNRTGVGGGGDESYRMVSGSSATTAIRAADAAVYAQGHGFCRGEEDGEAVTIGFSAGAKVWANRRGPLLELLEWIAQLAEKLRDPSEVVTGSNLDMLSPARRVAKIEAEIIAADLPHEAYQRASARVRCGTAQAWLVDLGVEIVSQTTTSATFRLHGGGVSCLFELDVTARPVVRAADTSGAVLTDEQGHSSAPFADYLAEHPPIFWLRNLATLEGDLQIDPPGRSETTPIAAQIEAHDWAGAGVDPHVEKPVTGSATRSLFTYVEDTLLAGPARVVFTDDGAGEIADYVALVEEGERVRATLYHCKAASGATVPNASVEDLHEVVGQAVRSRRWLNAPRLLDQIAHRLKKTKALRFVRGGKVDADALIGNSAAVDFAVVIVQPALSTEPKETIAELLCAADAYMRGAHQGPLRMWGTAPAPKKPKKKGAKG